MAWKPVPFPDGPVAKEDSDMGYCSWCESPDGQPCKTSACGTYDD